MAVYYAQTSGNLSTSAVSPQPIPGLSVKIPAGVGDQILVVLNVPNPYATPGAGTQFPGGWFGIAVDGKVQPAFASFTYNEAQPPSTGRVPTTLVIAVELAPNPQTIQGMWHGIRNSTVMLDSPATLSATL
jgi:hypothetical protein